MGDPSASEIFAPDGRFVSVVDNNRLDGKWTNQDVLRLSQSSLS